MNFVWIEKPGADGEYFMFMKWVLEQKFSQKWGNIWKNQLLLKELGQKACKIKCFFLYQNSEVFDQWGGLNKLEIDQINEIKMLNFIKPKLKN